MRYILLGVFLIGCGPSRQCVRMKVEISNLNAKNMELRRQVYTERRERERFENNVHNMEETVRQAMEIIEENKKRGVSK